MKNLCTAIAVLLVGIQIVLAAQAPESRGNDFMIAFAYNYQNGLGQTQTLYISSDQATTVVVATKTTTVSTVNVPAGGTVSVNVNSQYITAINTIQTMGLRVYSTDGKLFTLVGLNTYTATSDAFLAFPVNVLGTNYMTAGYTACCSTAGYTYIVAPEDGTTVTIAGTRTLDGGGTSRTYTLNSFQTVAVGITNGDITGFTVNSNKPVAVFGGAACANIPVGTGACNVLVDQIPPTNTWDTDFITVPIATRLAGDIYRVVSNKTGTVVTVNGVNVATLAFGAWYEFSSSVPNVIHTSEPALVMQYDKGSGADGVTSDPFSIWIPPVNQYAANYYISTPTGSYWSSYVNIVVKSGAQSGILYDGVAVTGCTWKTISGSSYVYCQKLVSGGGSHWVSHTSPIEQFEVIVYGFGSYDGFGYVGGNRLSPLQDPCTATTTVAGDAIDNDCDGKVDEEIRNGVDDDGDGLIDEDLAVDTCCYLQKANPVLTPSGSAASVTIYCGDSIPAEPTVTATVVCANITSFPVTSSTSTSGGSCPSANTITRTWSVTDNCGRTTTLTQTITVNPPQQTCGNGVVEGSEQCDGQACCSSSCTFASSSTSCRASNGPCDAAEYCTGSSSSCPADSFQSASTVCRASNGPCDVAEQCTGSSASCPADSFQSSSTICRASNGDCDVAESCTGSSASCPADSFQSASTVCRASNGDCDVAESCTGSSASCPADSFQSSSTVCRASNGICDVAESCTGSSASCPSDAKAATSTVCRASAGVCDNAEYCDGTDNCPTDSFKSSSSVCRSSIGPCDPQETCSGSSASCPADVSGAFESACAGLDLDFGADGTFSILNYDVISFNNFVGPTGAVDGRLAVKNDVTVGTSYAGGYSVGYYVHTDPNDISLPYALVAGGSLTFGGGAVYPDGNAYPGHPAGTRENIFVGTGSFTGQADLGDRVHGNCSGSNGCLNSAFSAAQTCYGGFQSAWAAQTDNVQKLIQWSGLYLDCQDPTSATKIYYLHLTATELTQFTWFSVSNCNANARWIITVPGTDDVTFTAGSFPAPANAVVYNVVGSGRTVNVVNVYLQGHVVAPFNTLNQPSGNIQGKVIAGNIPASLNINRVQCFFPQ